MQITTKGIFDRYFIFSLESVIYSHRIYMFYYNKFMTREGFF